MTDRAQNRANAEVQWREYELLVAQQAVINQRYPDRAKPLDPAVWRAFWTATVNLIEACDIEQTSLPGPLMRFLRFYARTLASGNRVPGMAASFGLSAQYPPGVQDAIGIAVGYIRWARGDYGFNVDERNPLKVIEALYGVKRRTVQRWLSEHDAIIHPGTGDQLWERLENAAKAYRRAGRSADALFGRSKAQQR